MAGVDRLLCFQVDVLRVLVLAKEEHGSRGQDQGCHIQQADRYGCMSDVTYTCKSACFQDRLGITQQTSIFKNFNTLQQH